MTDYQHLEVQITADGDHYASYTVTRQVGEGTAIVTYQENEHSRNARRLEIRVPCKPCNPLAMALAKGISVWDEMNRRERPVQLPVADNGEVVA